MARPEEGGRKTILLGAVVVGLGLLALLGWALQVPFLAGLGSDRIPMAPSTALLFVLYGTATVLRARRPPGLAARRFGLAVGFVGVVVALPLFVLSSRGIHPAVERLGFVAPASSSSVPLGHMSPVTALCFLSASLSLLLSLPAGSPRPWRSRTAWWSAALLLSAAGALLLAYLFGSPLFYGGTFIPPAATTSLAFAALATGLLGLARPPGAKPASLRAAPHPLLLVFVLLGAGIVIVGGLYLRGQARHYRAQVEGQLSALADLKTAALAQWRSERIGDASTFQSNRAFSALVERMVADPGDPDPREQVRGWLTRTRTSYGYDRVSLLDTEGRERLADPADGTPCSSGGAERMYEVLRSGGVTVHDFHRNDLDGKIYLTVLAPIFETREGGRALGTVALRIDPTTYVFPLLDRWPAQARTAETLLVRRDEGDALVLNPGRLRKRAALTTRIPLASREVAAVKAVLGQQGTFESRDYRGVAVVAALRAVPGSPWFLVARLDAAEVNAPLLERLGVMVLLVGTMLAAAAAGVAVVVRGQRLREVGQRLEVERERAWLHDVVARSLNEVYVFDPATLRFRFANRGACRNIGYTEDELSRLTPLDLKPEMTAEAFEAILRTLRAAGRPVHVFETIHRRKDGSRYPVEVHLQLVDAGGGAVFLAVVNDVTERRRSEARIRRLNRVYAVLSDINEAIVRIRDPQALFGAACRIAVEAGGFRMAWLGLLDAEASRLRPVAHAGAEDGFLATLPQLLSGETLESRRVVCNDIEHDPGAADRRVDALARGYRASAVFPLVVAGEALGVFTLYAGEPGFFDDEELRLLDEMAADLSFAMEMRRNEEARLRLATAIEQSPVSVTITTVGGRIEYVNPAFTWITGYAPGEADGMPAAPSHRERLEAIEAGRSWRGEVVGSRKDGTPYTQELTVAPIRDAAGRVTHIVTIGQDVTERKRAADAILREKAFSEALLESLPGFFCLFDRTGRPLRWNRTLEKVSGYTAAEIAASRPVDFFGVEDRELIAERIGRVFEAGAADAEVALLSKDGKRTPYYFVGVAIDVDGAPCCITMGFDIAARRHVEDQLRQAQKIEAIGRLAGGVAHDFNNIVAVIVGYGELAQAQLGPGHPARPRVDEMMKAAERAAGLTRQLLAFSRKQVTEPRVLDLGSIVDGTRSMLGRLIGEDVEVVIQRAPGLGAVRADPGQVEQVVMNLALNARDAMPKGGTLTLETENVDFDEAYAAAHPPAVAGRFVMLAVSDTGVGMDEATQSRLFEPFFTTKAPGEGTGLGLATVYGIVKQSAGFVWCYSEPGHGTTFKVYLPRVDEAVRADRVSLAAAEDPRGAETILVAEDTEELRNVLRETLTERGYTVLLAANGEEALELARAHAGPIQLLLTDVVMPRAGGAELAERLAVLRPGVRVLFMSGYTNGVISQHGVLKEGVHLLQKPFTGRGLAQAVRAVLDAPREAPPSAGGATGRVLLVEDDVQVRKLTTLTLERAGYRTDGVGTVAAAIEALASGCDYAAILCDLTLPDGSGEDVLRRLRQTRPELCGRVIVLTGGAANGVRERLAAAGVTTVLQKPVSRDELLAGVATVAGR